VLIAALVTYARIIRAIEHVIGLEMVSTPRAPRI